MRSCGHCGDDLVRPTARVFCSQSCRQKAARRRALGIPENAILRGSRGQLPLGESYRRDVAADLLSTLSELAA